MHSNHIITGVAVNIGAESSSSDNTLRHISGNKFVANSNSKTIKQPSNTILGGLIKEELAPLQRIEFNSGHSKISENFSFSSYSKNTELIKKNMETRHRRFQNSYSPKDSPQKTTSSENYKYNQQTISSSNESQKLQRHRNKNSMHDNGKNMKKKRSRSSIGRRSSIDSDGTYTSSASIVSSCNSSCNSEDGESRSSSSGEPNLAYPGFPELAFKYLTQDTRPRNWCLLLITNPWFERVSIIVILLNCITLGMYQPCVDDACESNRCKILQIFDDIIFAFFALEMSIKMVAMGMYGKNTYLADSWNRLDFFIVFAGLLEYIMHVENLNLTAIRTIRVLRPLRAINRIPSMRILVMLLLDTLPMLGNVLLLCFFVFFIFGIIGVQLWEGILRQRCMFEPPSKAISIPNISFYYEFSKEQDYICSKPEDSGMHLCSNLPPYRIGPLICTEMAKPNHDNKPTNTSCVNWNQYYSRCEQSSLNPFQGTISFDNIGMAWVAIFLVISLEGWTDIMYYVQDAHSFWDWIYFVLLIVIGSFFMINLCLVVIATQFSETKKREMERMRQERARYTSSSTLASSTNNSEPATCYAEIVKYIAHLWRRFKRRMLKKYRLYKSQKQQHKELLQNTENLTFSPSRIKSHHPNCTKISKLKNLTGREKLITVMVPLNSNNNARNTTTFTNNVSTPTPNTSVSLINKNNIVNNNEVIGNNYVQPAQVMHQASLLSSGDNSEHSTDNSALDRKWKTSLNSTNNKDHNNVIKGKKNMSIEDIQINRYQPQQHKTIVLKIPPNTSDTDHLINQPCTSGFLSPPSSGSRRPSVMFNEFVLLHTPPVLSDNLQPEKGIYSTEKMTQTSDGSVWQVNLPQQITSISSPYVDCSELGIHDAMTCQELLAFSVAFSAVLPTGQSTLDSFYSSLTRCDKQREEDVLCNESRAHKLMKKLNTKQNTKCKIEVGTQLSTGKLVEDYSCCYHLYQNTLSPLEGNKSYSMGIMRFINFYKCLINICSFIRRYIKCIVEHKYFQQGILLAILINTLSMGIEYHDQPEILTAVVETSNIVFSGVFAVEMLLKVIAEGPFRYIANGFNVFDGIIVILSAIEICQQYLGNGGGGGASGLSVLRTFRLLRILKLVRFMPNLRRQLFVMLRTMDNVAVFFSLLVLFIFIFSILGMYLFGGKFCKFMDESGIERECTCPEIINRHPKCECDRKHFNNILWATVTVFQILTQEDWNVVLFNGMEKTSHWAALYFVALMTFGNYVLFNLLVAILVEGFSSERNERREREQRELVKKLREETLAENFSDIIYNESKSEDESSTSNESIYEIRNRCRSADDFKKISNEASIGNKNDIKLSNTFSKEDQTRVAIMANNVPKIQEYEKRYIGNLNHFKDHTNTSQNMKNRLFRDPPLITTTAATPQDSPNNTLEQGIKFQNWVNEEQNERCTTLFLKPPTLLNGQKTINEGIPTDDSTYGFRKPLNILSANHLDANNFYNINHDGNIKLGSVDLVTKSFHPPSTSSCIPTISTNTTQPLSAPLLQEHLPSSYLSDNISQQVEEKNIINFNDSKVLQNNKNNLKRFRRMSSKKKLISNKSIIENNESQTIGLNDNSYLLNSSNSLTEETKTYFSSSLIKENYTPCAQNKSNRLCKPLRTGYGPRLRRSSACVINTNFHHNLNQSLERNPAHRRMSSVELTVSSAAAMKIPKLESACRSISHGSSKSDLDSWHQGFLNSNETGMLQQYIEAREKRKNSICQHNVKKNTKDQQPSKGSEVSSINYNTENVSKIKILINRLNLNTFFETRESFSLYLFSEDIKFRQICIWLVNQKWFDNVVLLFIALNCITLAMERPNIPPDSPERLFLSTANYVFTVVFTVEMFIKVVATGMFYGNDAYFTSGWNLMDGSLVIISIIDLLMSVISQSSPRIFGILRVFRLLRSLRPLRVINRAPGLKLVVQTLLSSLRPIGNIVLICCTFFIIFGILGVQLFKGTFFYCEGENIKDVQNKTDCLEHPGNAWVNRKYNFDDLGKALMSLFVLSSRDGWVNIMYTGLDAVGVDQQPIVNYNEWRLLYFIAFILLVGFFVLNMFVGVVVENFHRCREEQEKEEKIRRAAKRALQMEKKRRRMHEPPYYTNYSSTRMFVHNVVTSKYFDLAIAAVIGLNVVTMAMEYYRMPVPLQYALKIFNYFFTAVFILEANMKLVALGIRLYLKDKWNQLDVGIVILSIVGIVLEELDNKETKIIPINPTIIRVMRVMRIARVLKLLKMAKGIRALLDTVMQALPQVGNLGLLFFLLFFIFAALGVELFGRLECSDEIPCQGLGEHAHFANFGMAFLTLFRVATGDNWNGIMKDTLRDNCDDATDCVRNCCVSSVIAPIFFVIFVLMAQFVLVNVVVAVLMKHLEESHKQMEDEMDMEVELERELVREQELQQEQKLCQELQHQTKMLPTQRHLSKVKSLPMNFTYSSPLSEKRNQNSTSYGSVRRQTIQCSNQHKINLADTESCILRNSIQYTNKKHTFPSKFQINKTKEFISSADKNSTMFNKRGFLSKEQSLDEQALRRRNLESNRISYDSLPSGTIFENNEYNNSLIFNCRNPNSTNIIDKRIYTEQTHVLEKQSKSGNMKGDFNKNVLQRSPSIEQTNNNLSRTTLLSVPRSLTTQSKCGSTKQLFKQQALEEDQDMDENTLLLPMTLNKSAINISNEKSMTRVDSLHALHKCDSSDILRIISERRKMDKLNDFGNEDSDYKELLLFKSSRTLEGAR